MYLITTVYASTSQYDVANVLNVRCYEKVTLRVHN